jgi:hypothetical protein
MLSRGRLGSGNEADHVGELSRAGHASKNHAAGLRAEKSGGAAASETEYVFIREARGWSLISLHRGVDFMN